MGADQSGHQHLCYKPKSQHSQPFPEFCPALLPGRSHVPKGTVQNKDTGEVSSHVGV